ncbi:MAG TPA: hypothetical protein VLW83_13240, partial [Candidatus Acidoferrales bacterium]|nr:hypothetical protein [Candidatus Acidoferrales bacterium]
IGDAAATSVVGWAGPNDGADESFFKRFMLMVLNFQYKLRLTCHSVNSADAAPFRKIIRTCLAALL